MGTGSIARYAKAIAAERFKKSSALTKADEEKKLTPSGFKYLYRLPICTNLQCYHAMIKIDNACSLWCGVDNGGTLVPIVRVLMTLGVDLHVRNCELKRGGEKKGGRGGLIA